MTLVLYDTRYDIIPRLSLDARRRVVTLFEKGICVKDIQKHLEEENASVTRQTLYRDQRNDSRSSQKETIA